MRPWPNTSKPTFPEIEHEPEQKTAMAEWAETRLAALRRADGVAFEEERHIMASKWDRDSQRIFAKHSGRKLVMVAALIGWIALAVYFGVRS